MSEYPHVFQAHEYAMAVIEGEIPACELTRLACQRQLDDLERSQGDWPYYFDPEAGERVCRFIEGLPHIKGIWAKKGLNIKLEPWQQFCLVVAFGWKRKGDGTRRFREAYLEVPRKNAKSTLGAGIGLYMLVADGEAGAEVYSGATKEDQAFEVFRPAKLMVEKAPGFKEHFGLEVNAKSIHQLATASFFRPVVGRPGDGASPHCSIVDEFHEHRSSELYDTMKTGMGSRMQPMLWIITTAGADLASPCYDKRDQVVKVLKGALENEALFGIIYTIDDDDDWTDFEVWRKANPNLGVSVFEDYLRAQLQEAIQRASQQNIIRCKHLNQWMNAGAAWINMVKWNRCHDPGLKLEDFAGEPCWVAIDLASKVDITSVVILFYRGEEFFVFDKHFLPEARLEEIKNDHYRKWRQEGYLVATPGERTDYGYIEDFLEELSTRFEIQEIIFDPHEAAYLITRLMERLPNCRMVDFPQNPSRISEPMKELEAAYLSGKLHHNSPVLTWMASNVVLREARNKKFYPAKEKPDKKIDGVVALIMAIDRAIRREERRSVYEDRGIVLI